MSRPACSWLSCLVLSSALVSGCATIKPGADYPRTPSTALAEPRQTPLGRQTAVWAAAHPDRSGFRILNNGVDGLLARIEMIDLATRTLDIQYYIFRLDDSGSLISEAILRAADRGVRVRILLDDGDTVPGDEKIVALDAHQNIEVRIYNPFVYRGHSNMLRAGEFALRGGSVDYRMHNKLFVTDNAIALTGGRNVGDEYFQIDAASYFGDVDLFAAGPIVRQMSDTFDEYWNGGPTVPVRALVPTAHDPAALQALRQALASFKRGVRAQGVDYIARLKSGEPVTGILAERQPLAWAKAQLVSDSPDKRRIARGDEWGSTSFKPVAEAMAQAQRELVIVTPFFVPGRDGVALLQSLRERGVRVRILTNSLAATPEPIVHSAYRRYRAQLLKMGVELYEVRSQLGSPRGSGTSSEVLTRHGHYSLHAKLFVFDRQRVFLGSMNFDKRSENINTEIGALIDSHELADQVTRRFDAIAQPLNSYALKLIPAQGGVPEHLNWLTYENGQAVVYDKEPAAGPWQRLWVDLMALYPFDGEL